MKNLQHVRADLTLILGVGPLCHYQLQQHGTEATSGIADLDPDGDFLKTGRYDGAPHVLALLSDLSTAYPNISRIYVKQWDFSLDSGAACIEAVRAWARQHAVPLMVVDMEAWLAAHEKAAG